MNKVLSLLFFAVATDAAKKCPGHFRGGVSNLCEGHFPDKTSDKVWFVKFYAPWCGHCNNMKPAWQSMGDDLKSDPAIGIGGVDCTADNNQGLCQKYGVQGYPTIKTIVNGKAKAYNGPRELQPMKQHILEMKSKKGSAGGSAKCNPGVFKSKVKDGVVPLCKKHFPDKSSKHEWVIALYNKDSFPDSDKFNKMAIAFGNEPPEKNKSRKVVQRQNERIPVIMDVYGIKGTVTGDSRKSKDAIAKFGAVCCDCSDDEKKFCAEMGFKGTPLIKVVKSMGRNMADFNVNSKLHEGKAAAHILTEMKVLMKGTAVVSDDADGPESESTEAAGSAESESVEASSEESTCTGDQCSTKPPKSPLDSEKGAEL